jgi:RNA polymerase sigma factor (sigma-70 family)
MQPSDEALVSACRRGDEAAWEMLINRYQRLVYTVPYRAGLDEELCADVIQSVFTKLVEKLDELDQPSRVSAWLVTAARRETWRASQRARSHGVSLDGAGQPIDVPDDRLLPDEVLVRLEEQHLVRSAVDSLDQRCRTLLLLLFYQPDPPSYVEIAATMGMNEGSIGPTRGRCLEKLLRLLGKLGIVSGYILASIGLEIEQHNAALMMWL